MLRPTCLFDHSTNDEAGRYSALAGLLSSSDTFCFRIKATLLHPLRLKKLYAQRSRTKEIPHDK